MSEILINSRFTQKIDTYSAWQSSSLVLKKGEIAIAEIPSQQTATGLTPPAIGVKIGDGTNLFKDLPWIQSTAGDVYAWAKKENLEYADLTESFKESLAGLVGETIQDTNTTYYFEYKDNTLVINKKEKTEAEPKEYVKIPIDLTTKIDKVSNATAGDVATMTADGQVADSGVKLADLETKANAAATYETIANVAILEGTVSTISGKVNTLIGSDADKSVRTIANEELAKQLLGETKAEDDFKTLQELAAWLEDHPEEAAEYNQRIAALEGTVGDSTKGLVADVATNASDISTLNTKVGEHTTQIGALEEKVSGADGNGGLIADVADIKASLGLEGNGDDTLSARIQANADDIDALEEKVSGADGNGGLIADVADHETRITTLETTATNYGTRLGALESANTTNTGDISTLKTNVGALQTTVGNTSSGLVKDVNDLKTTVGDENSGLVQQIGVIEGAASTAVQTIQGVTVEKAGTVATVTGVPVNLLKNVENYTLVFNAGAASTVI